MCKKHKKGKDGKHPGGRPRWEVTPEMLEEIIKLNSMHCTVQEIADWYGISRDTYYERMKDNKEFSDAVKKARVDGKFSLRRWQWKAAQDGNITMQIFLGKQPDILGQTDKCIVIERDETNKPRPLENMTDEELLEDAGMDEQW